MCVTFSCFINGTTESFKRCIMDFNHSLLCECT